MNLENFPIEVLERIFDFDETSSQVIELCKSGSRRLTHKLANGGVRRMSLKHQWATTNSRWPLCLKYFQLEELEIDTCSETLGPLESLRSELQRVHSKLRSSHFASLAQSTSFSVPSWNRPGATAVRSLLTCTCSKRMIPKKRSL